MAGKISDNAYNVELAGNGPYGFVYAYFHNQLDYNRYYRKEDRNLVRSYLRQALRADNVTFTGPVDTLDVTRRVENHNALTDRRPNVVLITVESLSSDFMGTFHGEKDWTPNLDKLASQSLVFPGCTRREHARCGGWKPWRWPCLPHQASLFCAAPIMPDFYAGKCAEPGRVSDGFPVWGIRVL